MTFNVSDAMLQHAIQRNEVIVQVPQEADIVPILGAHPWRKILIRGKEEDGERVSYVFPYNYRIKGDPAKRRFLCMSYERCIVYMSPSTTDLECR